MISKYVPKEYTVAQLAYMAGIMDGEGCFIIGAYAKNPKTGTPHFHTTMQVSSTDEILIDWIVENFGGKKSFYTAKQTPINSRRAVYRWTGHSDRVKHMCEVLMPYLVIKKDQAKVMIEMRNTFEKTRMQKGQQGTQPISQDILALRYSLFDKMKSLHIR